MIICPKCGHKNADSHATCTMCGATFPLDCEDNKLKSTYGKKALVFGILSIIFFIFAPFAIIKGNSASDTSTGKAGKALGIISLFLWGAIVLYNIIMWGM